MANYGFTVPQSGYDDGDRLKAWDRADGNKSQSWNLSLVGDWSSQTENGTTTTRTHGPTHTLTAVGSQPVLSDSRGNLTQPGDGRTFSYDLDRMLSSVTVTASAPGIEGTHTYTFDALGRRVSKIVAPTGGTSSTLVFVHSGHQIVAEYSPGQVATNPLRKYAFGSYIDEPVALIDHTGAASGTGTGANNGTTTVYHYHANHLYSVAALTDPSGQVVERYAYDAYGQQVTLDGAATTVRTSSLLHNRFTYTGREWDAESGTYHYRARTYDPRLAKFLQRDPIGFAGGLNQSAYVGGHPLDLTDPSGHVWSWPLAGVGATAGFIGGAAVGGFVATGLGIYNGDLTLGSVGGGIVGGALGGAATGAIVGGAVGAGTGDPSFLLLAGAGVAGGVIGGVAGEVTGRTLDGEPVTAEGVVISGAVGGVVGGVLTPLGPPIAKGAGSLLRRCGCTSRTAPPPKVPTPTEPIPPVKLDSPATPPKSLPDLRRKLEELADSDLLPKYRQIDPDLEAGYTGSFSTGKVGNSSKPTFGDPIHLDDFDIDYWIKSSKLNDLMGDNLRADPAFRKLLSETPGFEGLRPNKKGFSILFKRCY